MGVRLDYHSSRSHVVDAWPGATDVFLVLSIMFDVDVTVDAWIKVAGQR